MIVAANRSIRLAVSNRPSVESVKDSENENVATKQGHAVLEYGTMNNRAGLRCLANIGSSIHKPASSGSLPRVASGIKIIGVPGWGPVFTRASEG